MAPAQETSRAFDIGEYLRECRALVIGEIRRIIPSESRFAPILYDLMLDYPLREAKGLRPALCIATCRALGGHLEAVLPSAAVVELYHNAFLIHDDVEDGSEKRRDSPTLHRKHGVPIAVNVGDAMLALALEPLLDNMRHLGMGKALRVLRAVARMARESAEGQAIELDWIRHGRWALSDDDYVDMVEKKTSWYSFITPVQIGAIVADAPPDRAEALVRFARLIGAAFQIQDDALNLEADEAPYGKEIAGDLWEGKHTLILMHALRSATDDDRGRARAILSKPRHAPSAAPAALDGVLDALVARGELSHEGRRAIATAAGAPGAVDGAKSAADVALLAGLIQRHASIPYARSVAERRATEARDLLDDCATWLPGSPHRDFLYGLVEFVIRRDR